MERLNNPRLKTASPICFLDSDVVINWISKEDDPVLHKPLWEAPHKILKLAEEGRIRGVLTLVNLLEIRFVLRRKKNFNEADIKEDIAKLLSILEIIVPDEVNLLGANKLQDKFFLSPFDAILLSAALSRENIVLISRDKAFLPTAEKLLEAATPEEFLKDKLPSLK